VRSKEQSARCFGLSEVEFNKALERSGFKKLRDRCHVPVGVKELDFAKGPTARYVFCNRRWRNPDDPLELEELRQGWLKLRECVWILGADLSFESLVQCCRVRYAQWARMTTNWNKSPRRVGRTKPPPAPSNAPRGSATLHDARALSSSLDPQGAHKRSDKHGGGGSGERPASEPSCGEDGREVDEWFDQILVCVNWELPEEVVSLPSNGARSWSPAA